MRMQARLLLSQLIFSLLKKPTICCGGGVEVACGGEGVFTRR